MTKKHDDTSTDQSTPVDVSAMDRQPVLVLPSRSSEEPPVGMRGTIHVTSDGSVEVHLTFADMFSRPATVRRVPLSAEQVDRLRASKIANGEYTLRLDESLAPTP
ncbi:hypothetical protein [Congregicoccus parvus]|uniref:hypothetical protein n=1 Tax=Congregicoccus parvus TaxID=3081749 RepID=UPI003FA56DE3